MVVSPLASLMMEKVSKIWETKIRCLFPISHILIIFLRNVVLEHANCVCELVKFVHERAMLSKLSSLPLCPRIHKSLRTMQISWINNYISKLK